MIFGKNQTTNNFIPTKRYRPKKTGNRNTQTVKSVTPLLRDKLHLLRAREQITFKLCLLVYKVRNGMAPNYIQDLCVPVSTRSALRSAARGDLVVPRTRRRLGNRAFCVASPAAWNSLPLDIRTASTLCSVYSKIGSRLTCFCICFNHQLNFE